MPTPAARKLAAAERALTKAVRAESAGVDRLPEEGAPGWTTAVKAALARAEKTNAAMRKVTAARAALEAETAEAAVAAANRGAPWA